MTAIALEVDLEQLEAELPQSDTDLDPTADCARVWCDFSAGPALVVGGFCEHCGSRGHDGL